MFPEGLPAAMPVVRGSGDAGFGRSADVQGIKVYRMQKNVSKPAQGRSFLEQRGSGHRPGAVRALCGACVKRCNSEALTMAGMKKRSGAGGRNLKDAPFYRQSGAGDLLRRRPRRRGIPAGAAADGQRARHPHGHRDLRRREMGDL